MPPARQLLDILTRDELLQLADHHGVTVCYRRQKVHLAEQLEAQGLASPGSWPTYPATG